MLAVATSLDISGARPQLWSEDLRRDVVLAHPRLDLGTEFLRCFTDQARRKPDSLAAASVASGIADRIAGNVLDHLRPHPELGSGRGTLPQLVEGHGRAAEK